MLEKNFQNGVCSYCESVKLVGGDVFDVPGDSDSWFHKCVRSAFNSHLIMAYAKFLILS